MIFIRSLFLACLIALGCSLLWISSAYRWDLNPTWAAWPVGVLVGLAVWFGGQRTFSRRNGLLAAAVTLAAIATSLYVIERIHVRQIRAQQNVLDSQEEGYLWPIATEIAEEWEQEGKSLDWPEGADLENALYEADFPADVWAAAQTRWNTLTPEEQRKEILFQKAMSSALHTQFSAAGSEQRLILRETVAHMPVITLLFIALSLGTAYLIGTGNDNSSRAQGSSSETSPS